MSNTDPVRNPQSVETTPVAMPKWTERLTVYGIVPRPKINRTQGKTLASLIALVRRMQDEEQALEGEESPELQAIYEKLTCIDSATKEWVIGGLCVGDSEPLCFHLIHRGPRLLADEGVCEALETAWLMVSDERLPQEDREHYRNLFKRIGDALAWVGSGNFKKSATSKTKYKRSTLPSTHQRRTVQYLEKLKQKFLDELEETKGKLAPSVLADRIHNAERRGGIAKQNALKRFRSWVKEHYPDLPGRTVNKK